VFYRSIDSNNLSTVDDRMLQHTKAISTSKSIKDFAILQSDPSCSENDSQLANKERLLYDNSDDLLNGFELALMNQLHQRGMIIAKRKGRFGNHQE
jgi:hypothetical protein